ncbi:MAG: hypothetical protein M2R45_00188 [Verrucomicrobia subdivision 3 bacterium]|nr:hypothetical protein [Limisphaerales bacterium]MCS1412353.1 hypothetical protein [Limisphaerales bacterium]
MESVHVAATSPECTYALKQLAIRKEAQKHLAQGISTSCDFQFADRIMDSGIQFHHNIVDDAGINLQSGPLRPR